MPREYKSKRYTSNWQGKSGYLDIDVAVKIVPAPLGGWDAISPLAAMEPKYAASIINWVPRTSYIDLRGGYTNWGKISKSPVNSLMTYRPSANLGAERLFAATSTQIWEVSNVSQPVLQVTGLGGDKFQYVNFTPAGGANWLLAVNGVDAQIRRFNGTTWSTSTVTGAGGAIFDNINIFKRRVWLIPPNSTNAFFLDTDAITGAAVAQDLGPFLSKGGFLMAMGTWTVDGGNGPDDMAVFLSSQGQAVVYKGTDPTNADVWQLVGVFNLPKPIGRRCFLSVGSDLLLITEQGVLPLSQALPFDPSASRSVAITNRIQNAITEAAMSYQDNYGWQLTSFPQQSLILLNIPQVESATQVQYCQNALTGAWTQFNGWNACCFEIFDGSLYFGGNDGWVNLAFVGGADNEEPILYDLKCAFNYLDEAGRIKSAGLLRPFLVSDGTFEPTIQIDIDFADTAQSAPITVFTPAGALWDSSLWDSSVWSTGVVTITNWISVNALGTALAIRLIVNLQGEASDPPYPPNVDTTKVLMQFNALASTQNFIDTNQGGSAHIWDVSGAGTAEISNSEFKFGGSSGRFNSARILTPNVSADMALHDFNFTIQGWFNLQATSSVGSPCIMGQSDAGFTNGWLLRREGGSNRIRFWVANPNTMVESSTLYTSAVNTGWHHVAVVRNNTNLRIYMDGVRESSVTVTTTLAATTAIMAISDRGGGPINEYWNGFLDEISIDIGVALWTDNFTPPTMAATGLFSGQSVPTLRVNTFQISVEYGGPV